jgi:ribosomal protein L37AE/L43A
MVESGIWDCEMCKWERICLGEEKLKIALIVNEDIKLKEK